jgi:hypothetical protein
MIKNISEEFNNEKDKNIGEGTENEASENEEALEKKLEELEKELKIKNDELERENHNIIENDINEIAKNAPMSESDKEIISSGLREKLTEFFNNSIRHDTKKIVKSAITIAVATGMILGYTNKAPNRVEIPIENQPKVALPTQTPTQQPEQFEYISTQVFPEETPQPHEINKEKYLEQNAISSIYDYEVDVNEPEKPTQPETQRPILSLTDEWSPEAKFLELKNGSGEFEASLFLEKNADANYWKRMAPDGRSIPIWNATEAALRFGEVTMKPGDTMSFTKKIGFGDIISETELKSGEVVHGDGYLVNGEGACFAATVFGEALGLFVIDDKGNEIPLFKTDVGAVQGHGEDPHGHYEYLYHGPGVGINSSEAGQLIFSINPQLPKSVTVKIEMGIMDSNPEEPENGVFSPVVKITIDGLPKEWHTLKSLRLTGNRAEVLKAISGRDW